MSELRIASWNVGGGALADSIGAILRETDADVVTLQEVLFTDRQREVSHVPEIARAAGYRHFCARPLSPSHLHDDPAYGIGLAILSRFPLESPSLRLVPNPRITHEGPDGTVLYSHDKGYLVAAMHFDTVSVRVTNVHFLPFHDFERDPADDEFRVIWSLIDDTLLEWAGTPAVVAGDFNAWPLDDLLPKSRLRYQAALDGPTRPNGTRPDQVLVPCHWTLLGSEIRASASDHHVCIVDVRLNRSTEEP